MGADGSGPEPLLGAGMEAPAGAYDADASWSPDGTRIAFSSDRGGNSDIYVVALDGSAPVRLTDDPAADFSPAWS